MAKKLLYIVSLTILFVTRAWSQQDSVRFYHWSLGISTGDILHELFNADNSNKSYAAFVLEYAGKDYAVQVGLRPGYNKTDTQHEGFVDTEVTEQTALSGHLAGTKRIFSDRNWLIRAGLKLNGGWAQDDIIEDSGFDKVVTRRLQWNVGIGPMIDFRFYVHPRISLGMDASLIYSVNHSELEQIFTNFPDFNNTKDTVEGDEITFDEPATIYLRFHF